MDLDSEGGDVCLLVSVVESVRDEVKKNIAEEVDEPRESRWS